ncbi:hypothetical protein C3E99_17485 [Sphingopyxis sp. MG]|nr:hypothetical protein C3E99_17485 [Sphingopyxis sp. MG]
MGMSDMKNTLALAFSLVALALPATAAQAAATVNVSTGQGAPGTADPMWTVGPNESLAFIPTQIHPNWFSGGAPAGTNGNNDGARWITPTSNGLANQPAGTVVYSAVFGLSQVATLANLTANFWSDNRVLSIVLNGVTLYANNNGLASQFNGPGTALNVQYASLNAGTNNLLEVTVQNDPGSSGNPAGLRFAGVFSAVPEPGTWMLMMLGLGAVGFSMRRRQKMQVRFQFA